jgi:hypothetical protein
MSDPGENEVAGKPIQIKEAGEVPSEVPGQRIYAPAPQMEEAPPGPLTRTEDRGDALTDFGKFLGTSAVQAAALVPGALGALREAGATPFDYLRSKTEGIPFDVARAQRLKAEKKIPERTPWALSMRAPTPEDVTQYIAGQGTGRYVPETPEGRALMAGATAAMMPGSPLVRLSAETRVPTSASEYARVMAPAGVSGAVSEYVGEKTGNPIAAMFAGEVGGIGTSFGSRAVGANITHPRELAERTVGRILREAESHGPGARAYLEERLSQMPTEEAQIANEILRQQEVNRQRQGLQTIGGMKPDLKAEYGLLGNAPKEAAARDVRSVFNDAYDIANENVRSLWEQKHLQNAMMYRNKSIDPLVSEIEGLSTPRQQAIPKEVSDTISAIKEKHGRDIPLLEMQDLRSQILSAARTAEQRGDNFSAKVLGDLGEKLRLTISDEKNIVFGDVTGNARQQWANAVAATKSLHDTFRVGRLADIVGSDNAKAKVAFNDTLRYLLNRPDGARNAELLQKALGQSVNTHIADYLIGDMTNNGTLVVTPKQVASYLGKKGDLIDQIPGARDRFESIARMSAKDQLLANIENNIGDPAALISAANRNRSLINQLPRTEREQIEAVERNARAAMRVDPDRTAPLQTLNSLAKGTTSDVLYGAATGRLRDAAMAYGAIQLIGHQLGLGDLVSGVGGIIAAGVTGPAIGAAARRLPVVPNLPENILSGHVQTLAMELLQRARTDPALQARLAAKPDLRGLTYFAPALPAMREAGEGAEEAGRHRPMIGQASGGRIERASGGRAGIDHGAEADKLIALADKAKKAHNSTTEPLLDQPDEMITKALAIADKAI